MGADVSNGCFRFGHRACPSRRLIKMPRREGFAEWPETQSLVEQASGAGPTLSRFGFFCNLGFFRIRADLSLDLVFAA